MYINTIKVSLILTLSLLFLVGCKSLVNQKSEAKNYKKAESIFEGYYAKNGNAFLYSVGTIGYKYIWTHSDGQKIDLTVIDLSGKIERKQVTGQENWTASTPTNFEELECPLILDGGMFNLKFKNREGNILNQSLLHKFECLEGQTQEVIKLMVKDLKLLSIK